MILYYADRFLKEHCENAEIMWHFRNQSVKSFFFIKIQPISSYSKIDQINQSKDIGKLGLFVMDFAVDNEYILMS